MGTVHRLHEAAPLRHPQPRRRIARAVGAGAAGPVFSLATSLLLVTAMLSSLISVVAPYPPLLPVLDWVFGISGALLVLSLVRDIRRG